MACVTANWPVLHQIHCVAHSCWLHGLPTVLRFAQSRSDDACFVIQIIRGGRPPKSHLCEIKTVHSSTERTSADVCLKESQGSYMKQTPNIISWCTVSIAIPNVATVKWQILLCSSWLSVPTSTSMTQLASTWSISCNILHLVHQQSLYKIQRSKLWTRTLRNYWLLIPANRQRALHHDVIKRMEARVPWT